MTANPIDEAFCVPGGWQSSDFIRHTGGDSYRLLSYPDGTVRFEHRCDRGERGRIICAPALRIGSGHTLTYNDARSPTVEQSILCPDCGTHGWVRAGFWVSA